MFASRGFRLSALFLVLLTMFSVVAVDTAEARRGGSFGSRGTRTYQTVPATPTSPTITAPVQRTTAAPTANRNGTQAAQTTAAQRAGWFGGGIGGWIIGEWAICPKLGENASKGVRNEVFDVKLLAGDIAEAWRQGADQYATVSLRYESRDILRDRTTGQIVSGDDSVTETTELWTFVRHGTGPWLVSAIQET